MVIRVNGLMRFQSGFPCCFYSELRGLLQRNDLSISPQPGNTDTCPREGTTARWAFPRETPTPAGPFCPRCLIASGRSRRSPGRRGAGAARTSHAPGDGARFCKRSATWGGSRARRPLPREQHLGRYALSPGNKNHRLARFNTRGAEAETSPRGGSDRADGATPATARPDRRGRAGDAAASRAPA